MNGLHIPGTPLVVDYWRQKNVPPRALFFLSHLHADHTCGTNVKLALPHSLHSTDGTCDFFPSQVELEIGESRLLHVVGPTEKVSVSVTVLDANHCPGSAMFLFEGYFGRILYTGDFRYSPTMSALSQLIQSRPVDLLYLDNTYCHKSCTFPPRETVTEEIINLIRGNKDGMTILGLHTLGKEDLLVAIAKSLGVWVGVAPGRYETLRLIEAENVFTTTSTAACEGSSLSYCPEEWDAACKYFAFLNEKRDFSRRLTVTPEDEDSVLVVLPTCIFSGDSAPPTPTHPSIKVVPYSDHSSFKELVEFVGVVKPRCIRPIVRSFSGNKSEILSSRCDMSVFDHLLDPTPLTSYEVPALISQLFAVGCQDNRPRPSSSVPSVRRSLEERSHGRRRKRASGVNFLSPRKESHDHHVTEVEAAKGNGSLATEDGNGSHDPRVTQDGNGISHDRHVTVSMRKSEDNVEHMINTTAQDLPSETERTLPVKTRERMQ
ncbi:5' exonuclease Apollo [Geodia barretti]|uniref:5' exonuclease Apollo n=1 Tax=Geodia barretti TaxID=519541 RepID=A0AA35U2H5_GEOBA|nr:5' exonuclease Apollo [Geodia barretti]